MKVINFGSLNIDLVYRVHDFVRPGETIAATGFAKYPGGKGLNQSIALARAGAEVIHCGAIGSDGHFLKDLLQSTGVNCAGIEEFPDLPSGQGIIQVNDDGENAIIICGGANQAIDGRFTERALSYAEAGDILLLQNEISNLPNIIRQASAKGMRIFLNPAPMTKAILDLPLNLIDTIIVNETEAEELKDSILPNINVLKTLGARGAIYNGEICVPAAKVANIVDTTAAGDTFIGYFIAGLLANKDVKEAMTMATKASAICISRSGAAPSIPTLQEVINY